MPQSRRRRDAPARLGLPAICGPVARLSAAQAGKKPQQYRVTAYFPGCGVNALPGLRAIGNLRYCSPDTRCAPPPREEHGVAVFPGGDAAHLSGLPDGAQQAKKKPVLAYELFLKYGGEGGIRTPDTLPYTHFPGVLLQPLGHLTILSFPLLPGTGANLGKYVSPVNQLF